MARCSLKIDRLRYHLYVTGATDFWVFEPDGAPLGVIVIQEHPASCTRGDADPQSLYKPYL